MTTTISEAGAHAAAAATDRIPAIKSPYDATGRGYHTPQTLAAYGVATFGNIKSVATYAALTALTSANGLVDNGVYQTLGRSSERDGGEGLWVYDSASTSTANGGTILAIDGGGAGRFFRLLDANKTHHVAWFGALGSATHTVNTDAIKACSAAIEALGTGRMEFDGSASYAIYGDTNDTSALGDFDNCKGVHLAFNGCTFTIARAFTGTQIIYPWLFNDCTNTIIGDHTVTCAQLDAPADSLNRGIWWMTFEGCDGITGGNITVNGGRIAFDLVRSNTTLTNQCRNVHIQSITTSYVFYPFDCRNTGMGVTVDRIRCTNGGRPFIGYGFRGVRINEMSTKDMTTAINISANSTGTSLDLSDPKTIGFYMRLHVDTPTSGGVGNLFNISVRGTAACTMRDITMEYERVVFTGANGSEQLCTLDKRSDDSTVDSTVRGHFVEDITLRGAVSGFNSSVNSIVMNLAGSSATTGSFAGDNVSNFKIAVTALDCTSAHYILGDFGAFKGGLDLTEFNFSGWQKWIGNRPKEYASPNLLPNGNFLVQQLGSSFTAASTPANNDDTYLYDGAILLSDGNDIVDLSINTASAPADTTGCVELAVQTANKKFGLLFPLEQKDCVGAIGEQVCASIRVRKGAANVTLDSFKMAIISWSGTADTITSDVVSAWNAAGSAPTLVANWTYETSVANSTNSQTLDNTFTTYCVTGAIDTASAKQFALFVWCDDTNATVNDTMLVCDAMLQPGWTTTAHPVGNYRDQLARCRRQLRQSDFYVPATTAQNLGVIDMRAVPTITGGGAGFTSTGTTADTLIAFQTAGAVATLTLDARL